MVSKVKLERVTVDAPGAFIRAEKMTHEQIWVRVDLKDRQVEFAISMSDLRGLVRELETVE